MTHGIAVDAVRRDRRRSGAEAAHCESRQDSGESAPFKAIEAAEIHRGLDRREPGPREVLTLFFLEDFGTLEIAGILAIPEGTVRSRLHYAKKALKERLTEGTKNV